MVLKFLIPVGLLLASGCRFSDGRAGEILTLSGDFNRGRDLVFESPMQCRACHRFGTGDEKMGPDLEKIGAKYDRRKLLETILEPSKEIEPKYVNYLVETTG